MSEQPFEFEFEISTFDLSLLPIDADLLRQNPEMLAEAVEDFYAEMFARMGGDAALSRSEGVIRVRWVSEEGVAGLLNAGMRLLQQGDLATGISLLQSVLAVDPDNEKALYNLGMALSDRGDLEDAVNLLTRLISLDPMFCRAWVALGIAYSRCGKTQEALAALEKSVELDENDPYALRNLGGLLANESPETALPYLKKAAELMPNEQAALYGYGSVLLKTGDVTGADKVLKKAVEINPLTTIAEEARSLRTQIAHSQMRSNAEGGVRMDVVMYCLAAIQKFKADPKSVAPVTMEISLLGRSGLDINNPTQKYTLSSMPGKFSGMQLVSYMFVGFRQLAPDMDPGIDLTKEYQQALSMAG